MLPFFPMTKGAKGLGFEGLKIKEVKSRKDLIYFIQKIV